MNARPTTARWAKADGDVLHHSRIGRECLQAMIDVRPYLTVTMRDRGVVHGWLKGLWHEHDAWHEALIPTAWRGSIILQDDVKEIELDFLDVESVRYAQAPIGLFESASPPRSALG
jgi:hypothetical protein